MLKKDIGFRTGPFVFLMISADLRSAKADGLSPEEALATQTAAQEPAAEEAVSSASAAPEEMPQAEPPVEKVPAASLAKPSAPAPLPLKKETVPVKSEVPAPPPASAMPAAADFWSTFSHGTILSEPNPDGEIVGAKDQKKMLGEGDTVYLASFKKEFMHGMEWVIYKVIKNVYH